jgi:hypothetical protein
MIKQSINQAISGEAINQWVIKPLIFSSINGEIDKSLRG